MPHNVSCSGYGKKIFICLCNFGKASLFHVSEMRISLYAYTFSRKLCFTWCNSHCLTLQKVLNSNFNSIFELQLFTLTQCFTDDQKIVNTDFEFVTALFIWNHYFSLPMLSFGRDNKKTFYAANEATIFRSNWNTMLVQLQSSLIFFSDFISYH